MKPRVDIERWYIAEHPHIGDLCVWGFPKNHPDTERVTNKKMIVSSPIVMPLLRVGSGIVETQNTVYNLVGPKLSLEEFMDALAEQCGMKRRASPELE